MSFIERGGGPDGHGMLGAVGLNPPDLIGRWRLERIIDDRLLRATGHARGTATFEPDGEGLRWYESGELDWAGATRPFSRTLLLRFDGGAWRVRFDDGRPFFDWALGVPATHDCAPDVYRGLVAEASPGFMITWHVTGPHKDYTSTTSYRADGRGRS